MKVVILAAGYATRLYPLTKDKPKALLQIGSRPLLDHLLDKINQLDGVDDVILVSNHCFFRQFEDWASGHGNIRVLDDKTISNDDRLGAVGDLLYAVKECSIDDDILVLASDNLFDGSLKDFVSFAVSNNSACIGIYDIKDPGIAAGRYGVMEIDASKRIRAIEEKPKKPKTTLISMGIYYFPKNSLKLISEYVKCSDKQDAPGHYATWLLAKIPVFSFLFSGKWYDIGSLEQLEEAGRNYK